MENGVLMPVREQERGRKSGSSELHFWTYIFSSRPVLLGGLRRVMLGGSRRVMWAGHAGTHG